MADAGPGLVSGSREATNWSRTGCLTCKRRRKKCDKAQPSCANCQRRQITCEGYPQLFVTQPVRDHRRRKHGAEATASLASPPETRATYSNTSYRETVWRDLRHRDDDHHGGARGTDELTWIHLVPNAPLADEDGSSRPEDGPFELFVESEGTAVATWGSRSDLQPAPGTRPPSPDGDNMQSKCYGPTTSTDLVGESAESHILQNDMSDLESIVEQLLSTNALSVLEGPSVFPNFSSQDYYYLQYLDEHAAKQLLNVDSGTTNPLRRLILPRAVDSIGVLNGICAVAACHQAQRSDPDSRVEPSATATKFYLKSVKCLQSLFDSGTGRTAVLPMTADDASVITVLLLCKYEIIRGSAMQWREHLDGLEHLLRVRGGINSLETECGHYVASFIRYHRIVADICQCKTMISSEAAGDSDEVAFSVVSLDAYSGCAHYLLRACHDISRLVGKVESEGNVSYSEFSEQTKTIIGCLGNPVIEPDAQVLLSNITVVQISRLLYVAQRIRYAGFIFLHSAVERASKVYGFCDAENSTLRSLFPYTKAQSLEGCLEMLAEVPIGDHCEFAGLVMALFLSGCEVENDHCRFLILDKLFAIERNFGLGHVCRVRDALMMIWQRKREHEPEPWWKIIQEMGWGIILC